MEEKKKGLITAFIFGGLLVVVNIIALIVGLISTDGGWGTIGIVIISLIISALVIIGELLYGFIKYKKENSDFGFGLLKGTTIMIIIFFAIFIVLTLSSMFNI